jgi:hypothetical protein
MGTPLIDRPDSVSCLLARPKMVDDHEVHKQIRLYTNKYYRLVAWKLAFRHQRRASYGAFAWPDAAEIFEQYLRCRALRTGTSA